MDARCKAWRRQRSRQEIAVMNRQPDAVAVASVEIGMRREKGLCLHGGRVGKAIDIMVAVARGIGCSMYSNFVAIGLSALSRSRRSMTALKPAGSAYCSLASSVTL